MIAPIEPWAIQMPAQTALAPAMTLSGLAPGRSYGSVEGHRPSCYPNIPLIDTRSPAVTTISFVKAAALKGKTVPGRVVLLISPESAMRLAIPSTEGDFAFTDLRPGKHWIVAAPTKERWFGNQPREVDLFAGRTQEVNLLTPETKP